MTTPRLLPDELRALAAAAHVLTRDGHVWRAGNRMPHPAAVLRPLLRQGLAETRNSQKIWITERGKLTLRIYREACDASS